MKIIYAILIVVALVANFMLRPTIYQRANNEVYPLHAKINGTKTQVEALLVWQQNSFNIWNLFFFFPTKHELILYNSEHDIKWDMKTEYKREFETKYKDTFNIPLWKYFLASITLLFFGAVYVLHHTGKTLQIDNQKWRETKQKDSFLSYKTYLLEKHPLKLHKGKARKLMREKVSEYKTFYSFLTAQNPGPGKHVLLKILDIIAKTGQLEVGVSYRFVNEIVEHKDRNKQEIKKVENYLAQIHNDPSLSNPEKDKAQKYLSYLQTQMDFNITEIGSHFKEKQNKGREQIITKLIDRVFARIFPEQIVTFVYNSKNTEVIFEVDYTVSSTDSLYSKSSEEHLPDNQKNFFTGVEFVWNMNAHSNSSTLFSHEFKSQPNTTFNIGSDKPGDVYKAMAMSAFVNFGKELLKYFGIQSTGIPSAEKADISSTSEKSCQQDLFKKFQKEVGDQIKEQAEESLAGQAEIFFEEYKEDITQMINSVTLELEQMMTVYVRGLVKGVDIGEMGAEAISAIFGSD